jgi:hypothetical protein
MSMRRGLLAGIACSCAALALIAATPAAASTTIGRLAPAPSVSCVGSTTDWLEPTVTTGTGYVVTAVPNAFALEISSWSHNAAPSPAVGALTFKVFRKVGEPATYKVVGHDGPRNLTAGTLNTFPTHIPVEPGDVIGINSTQPAATACNFFDATENPLIRAGNLADNESGDFGNADEKDVNVSAVISPSSVITLGDTKFNKRKGTATLVVNVPNPGQLVASGTGVGSAPLSVGAPDVEQLVIRATGKAKKKLKSKGKVGLTVQLTFTPTGGFANTTQINLKLKKKL